MLTDFASLQKKLLDAGFPLVGAVDYSLAEGAYQKHASRYRQWIQNGSHGEMKYLERGVDRRSNPRLVFPELKSVVVVAKPHPSQPIGNDQVRYARYLNGLDYHEVMKEELGKLFKEFPFQSKVCVDTSAVLERSWAALTGIGWIGKNTLLIHPQYGSYLFLAVIFTDALFGRAPQEHKDYCGPCTRCLDRCPTQAFPEPHYLEATKCVSYLTLEKRGAWKEEWNTEGFVAGCDLCQEVCPYNTKAAKYGSTSSTASYLIDDFEKLNLESEAEYEHRVQGTALSRIRYLDFKRNLEGAKRFSLRKK